MFLSVFAFLAAFAQTPPAKPHQVILHVLKPNVDGELVATSRHPAFGFHVESGTPAEDSWLVCEQSEEMRSEKGVSYPVVTVQCGDVKMILSGVDLGD